MKIFKYFACALACGVMTMAPACSDDDDAPTPDADNSSAEITFQGTLTSSVPAMQDFTPFSTPDEAVLTWDDDAHTSATVTIGAFDINVAQMGMSISIGDMTISGIKCEKESDGSVSMLAESFTCVAGDYTTRGSSDGELRDDVLTLTVNYYPGAMPFEVSSVFTGSVVE